MITPSEKSQYERSCITAAGYCASCTKPLAPDETFCCNECANEAYVETDPHGVMHDEDSLGDAAKAV